jgi:hypothetical protein
MGPADWRAITVRRDGMPISGVQRGWLRSRVFMPGGHLTVDAPVKWPHADMARQNRDF